MGSCEAQVSPQTQPNPAPVSMGFRRNYILRAESVVCLQDFAFIRVITPIFGQLFHGFVIGKDIAVNASKQRRSNFENRHKEMVGRLANGSIFHY